jgi:CheY-like chemotaxis protein/HPt (histidine-containing phosphotransfer) domain-containing protein/anti-sigma regulatory factor (Ser/Thr protein kinase)
MVDLLRSLPLDQRVREVVDGVHRSTHALRSMIDDLLDLARLETGHLDLDERPLPLRELLESVTAPLQQQARNQGILLLPAVAPDLTTMVVADAARLGQVLTNLVGNAVKFTDAGEVVVTAEPSGDRLLITVSDTGPGLDEHDRARVLAPFVQADASTARQHEGAGLGLAIAARLVARMGGVIEVESTVGSGSTFRVLLPLVPGPEAEPTAVLLPGLRRIAVAASTARSATAFAWILTAAGAAVTGIDPRQLGRDLVPDVDAVLWCDDARDTAAAARATAIVAALGPDLRTVMISTTDPRGGGVVTGPAVITAPITARRLVAMINAERTGVRGTPITVPVLPAGRVLLVEDNAVNRVVFQRMIEVLGVTCDPAGDGEAAIRAVLDGPPYDVVLMDVQMPGVDGLEATRRLRAAGSAVAVLALTATALRGDRERCLAAGMNAHLQKPITLPELRAALAPYLEPGDGPGSDQGYRDGPPPAASTVPPPAPAATALAEPPTTPAVDLNRLRALAEELADRPLVVATVSTFLAELDRRRTAMTDAADRGDREALRATAHTLKSSSALLGADTLAAACAAVERRATTAARHDLARLLTAVDQAAVPAAAALAGYIATPP